MRVQELCLILKRIVDDLLKKPEIKPVNSISITKKQENIISNYKPDLKNEIRKIFKNKRKYNRAIESYLWLLSNVPGIEISENGQMISPMKSINILDFLKHVYSESKSIPSDTLELYKIFVALTDFPDKFIDNLKIKKYVYSEFVNPNKDNMNIEVKSRKRKLTFPQMSIPKIAKSDKYDVLNDDNDDLNDDNDDGEDQTNKQKTYKYKTFLKIYKRCQR